MRLPHIWQSMGTWVESSVVATLRLERHIDKVSQLQPPPCKFRTKHEMRHRPHIRMKCEKLAMDRHSNTGHEYGMYPI